MPWVNAYAVMNAAKRKARERLERAREPVIAYYLVPRTILDDLQQRNRSWLDLASAADLAGCRIVRVQKRQMPEIPLEPDMAIVYEGRRGDITLARQNW